MSEQILSFYVALRFNAQFWKNDRASRDKIIRNCCETLTAAADTSFFYQVFPARAEYDILVWLTARCTSLDTPDTQFRMLGTALCRYRDAIDIPYTLCGITKPSLYIRQRENPQEIDPIKGAREPYLVVYPFTKTAEWYQKSREERQKMMNGHIKLGRTYPEIKQLLLYSFGIQDQEFVVAYEMRDLPMFSDLVQELRATEARAYTQCDTPIITGTLRTVDDLTDIFAGRQ